MTENQQTVHENSKITRKSSPASGLRKTIFLAIGALLLIGFLYLITTNMGNKTETQTVNKTPQPQDTVTIAPQNRTQVKKLGLYDVHFVLFEGWEMKEVNRRKAATVALHECADYELTHTASGVSLALKPNCGQTAPGSQQAPEAADIVKEIGTGRVLARYPQNGKTSYATGEGTNDSEDVKNVDTVVKLPGTQDPIYMTVELTGTNPDALMQADSMVSSIRELEKVDEE